jgi:pimeloyl-ACP methyl ester carboxylesterase
MKSVALSTFAILAATSLTRAQSENLPTYPVSDDVTFNFDILSTMGQIPNDGADVSPSLEASNNITPGDRESFTLAWFNLANKTKQQALDPEIAYDPVNVRATWFSVASYFRRADTYNRADWNDPRINSYWEEQQEAFDKAIAALPVPARRIAIPTDGFTIEAIWYPHSNNIERRPTILMGQGFDAAQEDLYATFVAPALQRGYHVLTFEGPGQNKPRRDQGVGFIPDWERVVTPVVDLVLSDLADYVDPDRLVLYGHSFGGYLEARAAAFEHRISALVLNGGVYDSFMVYSTPLSDDLRQLLESGEQERFDESVAELVQAEETPTQIKWGVEQGLWSFNTHSPFEWFQMLREYNLTGLTDNIQVPVWLADGEFEDVNAGQSQLVKDAMGDRAELHLFNGSAGYHCQTGASQEFGRVIFAWLNKALNKEA